MAETESKKELTLEELLSNTDRPVALVLGIQDKHPGPISSDSSVTVDFAEELFERLDGMDVVLFNEVDYDVNNPDSAKAETIIQNPGLFRDVFNPTLEGYQLLIAGNHFKVPSGFEPLNAKNVDILFNEVYPLRTHGVEAAMVVFSGYDSQDQTAKNLKALCEDQKEIKVILRHDEFREFYMSDDFAKHVERKGSYARIHKARYDAGRQEVVITDMIIPTKHRIDMADHWKEFEFYLTEEMNCTIPEDNDRLIDRLRKFQEQLDRSATVFDSIVLSPTYNIKVHLDALTELLDKKHHIISSVLKQNVLRSYVRLMSHIDCEYLSEDMDRLENLSKRVFDSISHGLPAQLLNSADRAVSRYGGGGEIFFHSAVPMINETLREWNAQYQEDNTHTLARTFLTFTDALYMNCEDYENTPDVLTVIKAYTGSMDVKSGRRYLEKLQEACALDGWKRLAEKATTVYEAVTARKEEYKQHAERKIRIEQAQTLLGAPEDLENITGGAVPPERSIQPVRPDASPKRPASPPRASGQYKPARRGQQNPAMLNIQDQLDEPTRRLIEKSRAQHGMSSLPQAPAEPPQAPTPPATPDVKKRTGAVYELKPQKPEKPFPGHEHPALLNLQDQLDESTRKKIDESRAQHGMSSLPQAPAEPPKAPTPPIPEPPKAPTPPIPEPPKAPATPSAPPLEQLVEESQAHITHNQPDTTSAQADARGEKTYHTPGGLNRMTGRKLGPGIDTDDVIDLDGIADSYKSDDTNAEEGDKTIRKMPRVPPPKSRTLSMGSYPGGGTGGSGGRGSGSRSKKPLYIVLGIATGIMALTAGTLFYTFSGNEANVKRESKATQASLTHPTKKPQYQQPVKTETVPVQRTGIKTPMIPMQPVETLDELSGGVADDAGEPDSDSAYKGAATTLADKLVDAGNAKIAEAEEAKAAADTSAEPAVAVASIEQCFGTTDAYTPTSDIWETCSESFGDYGPYEEPAAVPAEAPLKEETAVAVKEETVVYETLVKAKKPKKGGKTKVASAGKHYNRSFKPVKNEAAYWKYVKRKAQDKDVKFSGNCGTCIKIGQQHPSTQHYRPLPKSNKSYRPLPQRKKYRPLPK